jgi:CBS domain containing-hemolysin-like protein
MIKSIILILVVVFSVIFAGLFAGAETGIYQLSRLRLRLGIEKKRLSFIILGKSLRDSSALLISMLIGTNLAYYLTTSIVTFLLLSKLQAEHTAELFATLITAPLLFVFSELIPKNIFFYRSDILMPCVAPILFSFKTLLTWCGMVPVLKFVSRIFARLTGSPRPSETAITAVRQSHIRTVLRETREEGFLSPVQTDIMNRLASISHLSVKSVMTPIGKARTVDSNSDNSTLLRKLKKSAFTRLPVYEHHPANIVGFINIYDCLSSPGQFTDLHDFIKPIRRFDADTVVTEAINIMQSENQKIVLITRVGHAGRERPIGIVTMKDLVEELLGELADW